MDRLLNDRRDGLSTPIWRVPDKEFLRASGQVQSLIRSLKLLTALANHIDGLSLSVAAGLVGLPASTAHRLLSTLQNERFVRFDSERSRWHVGLQAFKVGQAFVGSRDLGQIARPFVKRLAEQSGESVALVAMRNHESVIVTQAGPTRGFNSQQGTVLSRLFSAHREPAGELARLKATGYAVFEEEDPVGSRGVAAAVFDEHGAPLAALVVLGPRDRLTVQRADALGEAARGMAKEITMELGGHAPVVAA